MASFHKLLLFVKISQHSKENKYVSVCFPIKLQTLSLRLYEEETGAGVSLGYGETLKRTYFIKQV